MILHPYYSRPSLIRTTLIRTLANGNELRLTNIHYFSIVHTCELVVRIIHVREFVVRKVHITHVGQLWYEHVNSSWQLQREVKRSHKTLDHRQQTRTIGEADST